MNNLHTHSPWKRHSSQRLGHAAYKEKDNFLNMSALLPRHDGLEKIVRHLLGGRKSGSNQKQAPVFEESVGAIIARARVTWLSSIDIELDLQWSELNCGYTTSLIIFINSQIIVTFIGEHSATFSLIFIIRCYIFI